MAVNLRKNVSLIATVAVLIITAVVGYYVISLKKAPYAVSDFESFTYKWGMGDDFENSYSSLSGDYQYLNSRDSLVKTNVRLRSNDIIFIHNKVNELGFWNLPNTIGKASVLGESVVCEIEFNYKGKSKKVTFHNNEDKHPGLLDSAKQIRDVLQQAIDEAEGRYNR